MPLIRKPLEHEGHFTQIPNAWLRDQRLSLRSIGLLGQLLSHRDGWSVTIDSVARANGCGRDAIRASVKELEDAGYLTRQQDRGQAGKFGETVWITTSPGESPLPDYPTTAEPPTVNPQHKKTITKNTIRKKHAHRFDEFWQIYPRRVGKAAAQRAFLAVDADLIDDLIAGAQRLAEDPNLPPKQFIPYPATWINRAGWEDEAYPDRDREARKDLPKAETPDGNAWRLELHNIGEHFACRPHWECQQG